VFDFLEAEVRYKICKALIEPKVIPPLHGDQVAEPVVCEFVRDGVGKRQEAFSGHFFLEEIEVVEGHYSSVFHGSPLVLVGKDLIVLIEGEGEVEEGLEEPHRLDSNFEDEGSQVLHMLEQRLDAVDRHGDVLVLLLLLQLQF